MNKRWVLTSLVLFSIIATCAAGQKASDSDSIRTLYVKENRKPDLDAVEIGTLLQYKWYDETPVFAGDNPQRYEVVGTPYARYGLYENLTFNASMPVGFVNSDIDGSAFGFEDISIGLELLAYEYTFTYPWIIPYVELKFPSGSKRKHLGQGEFDGIIGVAIGTTVYDELHYIIDGRFDTNVIGYDSGMFTGAGALIWNISEQFSVLVEGKITQEPELSSDGMPVYINGGMCYKPNEYLSINWYGGGSFNTEEKGHATLKLAYCF